MSELIRLTSLKLEIGQRYYPAEGEVLEAQTTRWGWRQILFVSRIEQAWLLFYRGARGKEFTRVATTRDAVDTFLLRRTHDRS